MAHGFMVWTEQISGLFISFNSNLVDFDSLLSETKHFHCQIGWASFNSCFGKSSIFRYRSQGKVRKVWPCVLRCNFLNFRYTCQFNITQYGENSKTTLSKYSDQLRRESVKEMLNLGLVAHMESLTPPNLPSSPEAAKKFQQENLTASVCKYNTHWA